ncbi:concanavalin A-like lectin/glucanase domain-containing protein [Aspergillus alliaceus]|uniref:Concanavalin A-like lectin/glucanase domain-containing protein n=1 Tax=Petromyces alliaceus TaxID=209559 RepID=A0A5N7CJP2_PETAA|nr:concanavalin A-like lectin/glucanase domain-containing protein [Aspergillus alliaceus]
MGPDTSVFHPSLPAPLARGYQLTWNDEFDYTLGSHLPASENWIIDLGTSYPDGAPRWGNNEAQRYTSAPSNIRVTPFNTLLITPRVRNNTWTSGRIETQRSDFAATPGGRLFIEGRLKTGCAPARRQQGIWPAFWALGMDFRWNRTNWPAASEWDIAEVVNGMPKVYNTLHCGTSPGGPCDETNGIGSGGVDWTGCEWHTVGFEVDRNVRAWYQEKLRWYLDGRKVFEIPAARVNNSATWEAVAHKGHFLLLNVAVGGNWPGAPNATTADGGEVQMEVDYVRVWNEYRRA